MTPRRTGLVLAALATLVPAVGCTTPTDPDDKDTPLPTRPVADARRQVQTDADLILQAAPGATVTLRTESPTPCTGRNGEFADDDRFYIGGGFHLTVEPAAQLTTIATIQNALTTNGWEITDTGTYADGTRGTLTARNPATGTTTSLNTTMSRKGIAVSTNSPCYMPAPGDKPF